MDISPKSPGFFTLRFHTVFFLPLLTRRIKGCKEEKGLGGTTFVSSLILEGTIFIALCLVLIALGLPRALAQGSIIGWVISGIGIAGFLGLFLFSLITRIAEGKPPSYDSFLIGIFFFFLTLGFSAGLFYGRMEHHSWGITVLEAGAGLIAGYLLGIFGGLYAQYLGFFAGFLDYLAKASVVGLIVVDLVIMFG